jgi:hypothetical protein
LPTGFSTVNWPLLAPTAVGENLTTTSHVAPGATVAGSPPQVVESYAKSLPLTSNLVTLRSALPVLVIVNVLVVAAEPTSCLP